MIFKPINDDIEYFGIDIVSNKIISQKIYYRMLTARKNIFDKSIAPFENAGKLKLFDYSRNDSKESFGYLVYEKMLHNLFRTSFFQKFYQNNKDDINFIDSIAREFRCYPPVLGIKYNFKKIESVSIYSNPPIDVKDYMQNYTFIQNRFNSFYKKSNYQFLCKNFLDEIISNEQAYLFLFGFDITEKSVKKHKFYLKLESKNCIEKIYTFMIKYFSFESEFLDDCFYTIPNKNNCYIDIAAFSFLDDKICLNIYYKLNDH